MLVAVFLSVGLGVDTDVICENAHLVSKTSIDHAATYKHYGLYGMHLDNYQVFSIMFIT